MARPFGTYKLKDEFPTAEDLEKRIDEYYAWAKENDKPLTCSRLASFLGITNNTLANYLNSDDSYFGAIKRAYQDILADKNERLLSNKGNVTGLIFDLKNNHGWKDSPLIDQSRHEHKENYVLIYRPEPYAKERVEASCRTADRSV